MPATVWNQRGRNTTAEMNPKDAKNVANTEIATVRMRNRSSGTIGSRKRDSHHTNTKPTMTPMSIRPPIQKSESPARSRVRTFVMPMRNGAIAPVNSAAPT